MKNHKKQMRFKFGSKKKWLVYSIGICLFLTSQFAGYKIFATDVFEKRNVNESKVDMTTISKLPTAELKFGNMEDTKQAEKTESESKAEQPESQIQEPVKEKEVRIASASKVTDPGLEGFVYEPNIPMPREHQEYLYKLVKERGLDYKKTLAIIKHESQFNPNEISKTNDYGYFQINKRVHEELAEALDTPMKPLDPYININWGTYKLSTIYKDLEEKGTSASKLDTYAWSTYNRGATGFEKYGVKADYVAKVKEALKEIEQITET